MGELIEDLQYRLKNSSTTIVTFILRALSGLILGWTLALIFEVIIGYGLLSFLLVIVVTTGAFLRISRTWTILQVFIFDLICVLLGLLLRMYILIAPGA